MPHNRELNIKFIDSELELGLAFCSVAKLAPRNSEKARKNTRNAQIALETASGLIEKTTLTDTERVIFLTKLERLRACLSAPTGT